MANDTSKEAKELLGQLSGIIGHRNVGDKNYDDIRELLGSIDKILNISSEPEPKPKPKKIKPPTRAQYKKAEIELALSYAPNIYACMKCGWPVVSGYCCNTCGDANPYHPEIITRKNISKAIGGKARAEALSLEKRKEIAKKAALARWNKDDKER